MNNPINVQNFLTPRPELAEGVNLGNPFAIDDNVFKKLDEAATTFRNKKQAEYDLWQNTIADVYSNADKYAGYTGEAGEYIANKKKSLVDFVLENAVEISQGNPMIAGQLNDKMGELGKYAELPKQDMAIEKSYQTAFQNPKFDQTLLKEKYDAWKVLPLAERAKSIFAPPIELRGAIDLPTWEKIANAGRIAGETTLDKIVGDKGKMLYGTFEKINLPSVLNSVNGYAPNEFDSKFKSEQAKNSNLTKDDFMMNYINTNSPYPIIKDKNGLFYMNKFDNQKIENSTQYKTEQDAIAKALEIQNQAKAVAKASEVAKAKAKYDNELEIDKYNRTVRQNKDLSNPKSTSQLTETEAFKIAQDNLKENSNFKKLIPEEQQKLLKKYAEGLMGSSNILPTTNIKDIVIINNLPYDALIIKQMAKDSQVTGGLQEEAIDNLSNEAVVGLFDLMKTTQATDTDVIAEYQKRVGATNPFSKNKSKRPSAVIPTNGGSGNKKPAWAKK
jgi:hypothetical protein